MAMGARRVLSEGEPPEAIPTQGIYRGTSQASRGTADDVDVAQASSRAARRRMSFDTTTIRPGWRNTTGMMTTTIIKTKHVSAEVPTPRRRRAAIIASAAVATVAAAAVSFGFLVPSQTQTPIDVGLPAAAVARNIGNTDVNQGLAQDAESASSLQDVSSVAAAALAADLQVQDQQTTAKDLATAAGKTTLAAAKAAWDKAQQEAGSPLDYTSSDKSGTPVPVPDGAFIWPVKSYRVTSGFGWRTDPVYGGSEFHSGIDLATPCGTPIYASGDGVVSFAGWYGGFGNYIEINHGTLRTGYGHQSKLVAKVGEHVQQGDLIGYVGSTGKSTGCHVHFQALTPKGQYFDPSTLIH